MRPHKNAKGEPCTCTFTKHLGFWGKIGNLPIQVVNVPGHDTQGDAHPIAYVPSMNTVFKGEHGMDHWGLVDNSPELKQLHYPEDGMLSRHPLERQIIPVHHGRMADNGEVHFFNEGAAEPEVLGQVAKALGGKPKFFNAWNDVFSKKADWNGSKLGLPDIIEGQTQAKDSLFHDMMAPDRTGVRPVVYHKPTKTVFLGQPGTHHADVVNEHSLHEDAFLEGTAPGFIEEPDVQPYDWTSDEIGGSHMNHLGYALVEPMHHGGYGLTTWGGFPHDAALALHAAGHINEVHHDQRWDQAFSKTANFVEVPASESYDYENPEERAIIYDRLNGTVYVGQPGSSHSTVYNHIKGTSPGHNMLDVRPERDYYKYLAINHTTGEMSEHNDELTPAERTHVHGLIHQHLGIEPKEPEGWADKFAKVAHSLVWEPGWPGKGFYKDGELTTWGINTNNHRMGWPHHVHMWQEKYPGEDLYEHIRNSTALMLNIEPDGKVREAHPYKGAWPNEIYQIDPRLKGYVEDENAWQDQF